MSGLCCNCSLILRQRSSKVHRNSKGLRQTCRHLPWSCSMHCSLWVEAGRRGGVGEGGSLGLGPPKWGAGVEWVVWADGMSGDGVIGTTEGGIGLWKMRYGGVIQDNVVGGLEECGRAVGLGALEWVVRQWVARPCLRGKLCCLYRPI